MKHPQTHPHLYLLNKIVRVKGAGTHVRTRSPHKNNLGDTKIDGI